MKQKIKHIISILTWCLLTLLTSVGLIASVSYRNNTMCTGAIITIFHNGNKCITEKEIKDLLNASSPLETSSIKTINLKNLEEALYTNKWIEQAELFIDNKGMLHANITQREPIARIFTTDGVNYYLDSLALRMPSNVTNPARVTVITGFTSNKDVLAKVDSLLLQNATQLAKEIYYDTLLQKQIVQINILQNGEFELYPLIGSHTVLFGNTERIKQKLSYLKAFYLQAMANNGVNSYEKIDVRFSNQIVATKSGTARAILDSVKAPMDTLNVQTIIDTSNRKIL